MTIFHNRFSFVALTIAFAVVLLGAGCGKQETPAGAGAQPSADEDDGLPPRWTEYRSETLGITIPYPEGWVTQGDEENRSVDFYEGTPPSSSDQPSAMWYQGRDGTLDQVIRDEFPAVLDRQETQRSGIQMTRITYPYDARLRPDEVMVAYLWAESSGPIKMIGGPKDSMVLEYAVDHLEVMP